MGISCHAKIHIPYPENAVQVRNRLLAATKNPWLCKEQGFERNLYF